MESLTAPIIAHLSQGTAKYPTLWRQVEGLLQLSELGTASKGPKKKPALYVVELSETALADVRGTNAPALQTVRCQIGVLIVADSKNGQHKDLTPLRARVRELLFGFTPTADAEPLTLVSGSLRQIKGSYVAWLDTFATEYTEDANSY
ncbi:hypothetical protein G3R49_12435 [Shewanella sp. WXL01]|uniref:phage tail terminator protein n=1 Tax=Shewanella sp. WXL01 TaxID=2709721 RepID=UPI0014385B47|nr:hypothetical protein [Shewanella sp. WXL01]NKF51365.1 hypothetical protein [Shewanella sp. WXL01]